MTIAFRAVGAAASGSAKTAAVPIPAGVAVGDLLIAVVLHKAQENTVTPAGFTEQLEIGGATGPREMAVAIRVADGTEGATYSFTWATAVNYHGVMFAYSGVDTASPMDATATTATSGTGTTVVCPSITTVTDAAWIFCAGMQPAASTITVPVSMTSRYQANPTADLALTCGDESIATAGVTGTRTMTSDTSSTSLRATLALRPGAEGQPLRSRVQYIPGHAARLTHGVWQP